MGFRLQGMTKTRSGSQVPDRDAQFRYINSAAKCFLCDKKQKEPIGDFARPGRTHRPKGQPITAPDHDVIDPEDLGRHLVWHR